MTIPQALEKYPMQLSAQLIRCWIQNGTCKFGYIIREGNRNTYYINEAELRSFLNGESAK